jgi:hypothetical protein
MLYPVGYVFLCIYARSWLMNKKTWAHMLFLLSNIAYLIFYMYDLIFHYMARWDPYLTKYLFSGITSTVEFLPCLAALLGTICFYHLCHENKESDQKDDTKEGVA